MALSRARVLLAAAFVAACPAVGRANGGGVDYVYVGGGAGSFRPRKTSQIRLLREDLQIALSPSSRRSGGADGGDASTPTHRVRARYRLSNAGAAQAARYAVPIVMPAIPDAIVGAGTVEARMRAEDVAATVRIGLGGEVHRCAFHAEPVLPPGATPTGLAPFGAHLGELGTELAGFCVTELTLPAGEFELVLSYAAPLFGLEERPPPAPECVPGRERSADGADCAPELRRRGYFLYYPFGAAASWAGRPEQVSVAVTLGGFRLDRAASAGLPADAAEAGGALRWTWRRPTLEGLDVVLRLSAPSADTQPLRTFDDIEAGQLRPCAPSAVEATSSSALPDIGARGYGPENAVDGAAATAWCVQTHGGGVGEWIALRFRAPAESGLLKAYGLYVLPGLGGSQRLYEANGRVTRIRYGACAPSAPRVEVDVPVADDLSASVVKVPGSDAVVTDLLKAMGSGEEACLRVEIAGTRPGARSADVCISELSLPMRCAY